MLKQVAIAAGLAVTVIGAAAPAMADAYCGPHYYYSRHWGQCEPYGYGPRAYYAPGPGPVGAAVGGAGYVAGSAVNAAGNVAGAAVGTAGAIVDSVLPH